jgi:hypothetical protein
MNASQINTADDVYRFVERLKSECHRNGATALLKELDDALHLGSSALEILGAIQQTVINHRSQVEGLLSSARKDEASGVIAFVDRTFGR